jgi:hypothetical protein
VINFKCTPYGNFKLTFAPGDVMIPRNYAEGPGSTTVNLRISKTFGFGSEGRSTAQNTNQNRGGAKGTDGNQQGNDGQRNNTMMGGGMASRGPGGPGGGGAGGGRGGGGFGGGGGGFGGGGFGGGGNAGSRYNLTMSVNFNNLLNHTNLSNPVGNLGSLLFGQSTSTSGGFGGFGGGGNTAYNRRIDVQLRFTF